MICGSSSTTRIFFRSSIAARRQVKNEPRSLAARLDPDLASVDLNDTADDREAHAESVTFAVAPPVEPLKHGLAIRLGDPGPFVLNEETNAAVVSTCSDLDRASRGRVLGRIV